MADLKGVRPDAPAEGTWRFISRTSVEWDRCRLVELQKLEVKNQPSFTEGDVIAKVSPDFRKYVEVDSLLVYLQSRAKFVDRGALEQIRSCPNPVKQCNQLIGHLEDLSTGSTSVVSSLLLSVMDSYEASGGGKSLYHHYTLAQILLDTVSKWKFRPPDVPEAIEKLRQVECDELKVTEFARTLGIHDQTFSSIGQACDKWLAIKGEECTFAKLVRALVLTPGLGKLVTGLCPYSRCNPPALQNWFKHLAGPDNDQWKKVAKYLGFTHEDIQPLLGTFYNDQEYIPQVLLRHLWIPDIGPDMDELLESLARAAGIEDAAKEFPEGAKQTSGAGIQGTSGAVAHVGNMPQFYLAAMQLHGVQASTGAVQNTNVGIVHHPQCLMLTAPTGRQYNTECPVMTLQEPQASASDQFPIGNACDSGDSKECGQSGLSCTVSERADEVIQVSDSQQAFAILDACINGEWDVAKTMLETGERDGTCMDVCRKDGKTILHYACEGGAQELVETLVNYGADVSMLTKDGMSVLNYVTVIKNEDLLRGLVLEFKRRNLRVDFNENEYPVTPLMMVCNEGDELCASAELLVDNGATPNGSSRAFSRPLIVACERGYHGLVEILAGKEDTDLNAQDKDGNTALLQACRRKRFNIADYLLDQPNININRSDKSGTTPLFVAISVNNYQLVKKLLDKNARINAVRQISNGIMMGSVEETPLAHACALGSEKLVELLIDRGADLNFKCSDTVPPIGFAIIGRRMNIVRTLLKCNTLDTSVFGLAPSIIIAVKIGNFECAKLLIDRLGGIEKAIQMAMENQLEELTAHITMFSSTEPRMQEQGLEGGWDPNSTGQGTLLLSGTTQDKKDNTLEQFSHLCVNVLKENEILKNVTLMDIATTAQAIYPENPNLATFFVDVAVDDRQAKPDLRRDFLFGLPSPLTFLIGQRILTLDAFVAQALKHFGNHPEEFFENLVLSFQAIPRGEGLPGDINGVLNHLFQGRFQINLSVGFGDEAGVRASSKPAGTSFGVPGRTIPGDRPPAYHDTSSEASKLTQGSEWQPKCINAKKSQHHAFQGTGFALGGSPDSESRLNTQPRSLVSESTVLREEEPFIPQESKPLEEPNLNQRQILTEQCLLEDHKKQSLPFTSHSQAEVSADANKDTDNYYSTRRLSSVENSDTSPAHDTPDPTVNQASKADERRRTFGCQRQDAHPPNPSTYHQSPETPEEDRVKLTLEQGSLSSFSDSSEGSRSGSPECFKAVTAQQSSSFVRSERNSNLQQAEVAKVSHAHMTATPRGTLPAQSKARDSLSTKDTRTFRQNQVKESQASTVKTTAPTKKTRPKTLHSQRTEGARVNRNVTSQASTRGALTSKSSPKVLRSTYTEGTPVSLKPQSSTRTASTSKKPSGKSTHDSALASRNSQVLTNKEIENHSKNPSEKASPRSQVTPYKRHQSAPGGKKSERTTLPRQSNSEVKAEHKKLIEVFHARMKLAVAPTPWFTACARGALQSYSHYTLKVLSGSTVYGDLDTSFRADATIPPYLKLIFDSIKDTQPDLMENEVDATVYAVCYQP